MKHLVRLFAILAALPSAGCGPTIVYDFVPPESPEGRLCAAQCSNTKVYCETTARAIHQSCESSYQMAVQSYNACKEAGRKHCLYPSACYYSGGSDCAANYRACFTLCGGRVQTRITEH